jgi:hypothetical protein
VIVARETGTQAAEPHGHDRAYRGSDPEAALARELLDLIDETNGASADDRLARVRARLEQDA